MAACLVALLRRFPVTLRHQCKLRNAQLVITKAFHKDTSTLLLPRTGNRQQTSTLLLPRTGNRQQISNPVKTRVCTCTWLPKHHGTLKSLSLPTTLSNAISTVSFTSSQDHVFEWRKDTRFGSPSLCNGFVVVPHTYAPYGIRCLSSSVPPTNTHFDRTLGSASSSQLPSAHLLRGAPSRSLFGLPDRSAWADAIAEAEKIVGYPTSFIGLRCLLSDELSNVAMQVRKLVGTRHPLVKTAKNLVYDGRHYIQTRGLIILLISKAAGPTPQGTDKQTMVRGIYPSQRTLAEIAEMIHTAFLVHKGVVNIRDLLPSDGPRSVMEFGNKISVLSGDFLLASACVGLAKLGNAHVVDLVSQAISDLTEAAFVACSSSEQEEGLGAGGRGQPPLPNLGVADWARYVYLSSGSLIAKSCRAALELAGHGERMQEAAFEFGKNIALAQQLHQELQVFTAVNGSQTSFSLTSAPVLLHLEGMRSRNRVSNQTKLDMKKLHRDICAGPALAKSRDLCRTYAEAAGQAIRGFPQSEARNALLNMTNAVS